MSRKSGTERISRFIQNFPFGPVSPPNAAITGITERPDGNTTEHIIVVSLANPEYDAKRGVLTYYVAVLADYSRFRLLDKAMGLEGKAVLGTEEVEQLGLLESVSLAIDSCNNWWWVRP